MNENERLVPICIIYLDGVRLNTALEGAFRSANVYDKMNGIGQCVISFDNYELKQEDKKSFGYDMRLSIHMGYKDNTKEVFNGEITEKTINLTEYGIELYKITASSFLWRLDHGEHSRDFVNKTPSQAIKDILSKYNIQSDCDNFGPNRKHWEGRMNISDLDLVLGLAKRYGKDVCTFGDKVYVKELMTHLKDEIIYEWGKSLISFDVKESIEEQVSKIHVFGWNQQMKKEFRAEVSADDLTQKIGGRNPWTKVSKGGSGLLVDYHCCHAAEDSEEAKVLALALMRENSFKYLRAEGSAEGNCKLSSGALVTVKYVGTTFSGDYIAECVVHRFSLEDGYITDFYLKRNMVSDEYVKLYSRSASSSGAVFEKNMRNDIRNALTRNNQNNEDRSTLQVGQDMSDGQFTNEMQSDTGRDNGLSEISQSDDVNDLKEVRAPANGTIFAIRFYANISEYGNYLVIQHNDGRFSIFAHLESIKVEERATVRQGDVIAIAGCTGTLPNMAAHLHWSVFENVNVLHTNTGNNGIFLGNNWIVNTARTVDPEILVNAGTFIHPSQGEITDPYGAREMPPPRNFHEGIDYSIRRRRE